MISEKDWKTQSNLLSFSKNRSTYPQQREAINSSKWFWLSSLIQGSFTDYPGVRLYVEIGDLRPASREERFAIDRRIKPLQWTKGSQLIWSEFTHVRDIKINDFRWIKYPKMMEHLI